jgi:extracellular elastinolytic metalloproteinase
MRRPMVRRHPIVRPRLDRLEDRAVPSGTPYYPPTTFLANPDFTTAGAKATVPPLDTALSFLGSHETQLGLAPVDLVHPIVTSQYTDTDTGISHVYLRQQVNGLPVINADFSVGIAANGSVISAGGGFVHDLQDTIGQPATAFPALNAADAVRAAAAAIGMPLSAAPAYVNNFVGPVAKAPMAFTLTAPTISTDPIPAKLVYAPTADGNAAEAWELVVNVPGGLHWYDMAVDATTGAVLAQADWVDNDAYSVVAPPNESPQDGGFTVLTNPYQNTTASPYGWQDTNGAPGPEFTTTQGNNVDAHLDTNNDNIADPTPGRPNGGANLDFSGFTFNPATAPNTVANQMAAQVNLFYINNLLHDVHYQYGFTEAAGNFQVNNYGNGGLGNDPVQADAQDGGGTNNANFATPVDGTSGRMQMYLWNLTSPNRDGDFDNSVIIHEFGHGVSNRLTGGPANSSALNNIQSGGMGEGWSDFYALMFLQRPTDTQNGGYGIGTYVLGQPQTGVGIRRFQYSYNMTTDPLMWDAYGTSGTTSYGVTRSTEVHNTGEIWTTTLWDMNWLLINKYGFDSDLATGWSASPGPAHAGNKLALRLVMDGLKLQPANPSFTQARDAIIQADVALDGGADLNEIWAAFARRGLGQGSSSGASSSTSTPTLSTTLPMLVQSVTPATGAIVAGHPLSYTLNVTAPITVASLDASDFAVNGQPATAVSYAAGAASATFTFTTDPVTVEGPQTVTIAANAFTRASDASGVAAYSSTFYVDATPLAVTAMSPAANSSTPPPLTTVDVTLNEPIDPASVQPSDLTISRGTVTGATVLPGNTTVEFTVANLATEQSGVALRVAAGAFLDPQGNPSAAFDDGSITIDFTTNPFPTPLTAVGPAGSLAYTGSIGGTITPAGDTDSFTLSLDAGQALTVKVTPDASLRPMVTVTGPGGTNQTATGAAVGTAALLTLVPITTAGTYTITVGGASGNGGGATTGAYTVQATLNTAAEAEANGGPTNDTTATAQDLTAGFLAQGGGMAAATVHGISDVSGVIPEVEPNSTPAQATPITAYSSGAGSNLYQLAISGSLGTTSDQDYFNIGAMQPGDVLTISESATGSGRGTSSDPFVYLYRAGSSTAVTSDDDSGPGNDALIYHFTITTADTYYVRAYRFSTSTTPGTYQLGVLLANSGTAPNTGGTLTSETEPNDSIAAANDASSSWKPIAYTAATSGSITTSDIDEYSFQFTAGDVVSLVAQSTSTLTPAAALLNSAGSVIASDDGTDGVGGSGGLSPLYGYRIPTTGTYYLRVTGASSSTGSYTTSVLLSTTSTETLAPPAQDLYSFNLAAGQAASAVVKGTNGALAVALLDPTGAVAAAGVAGPTNVDEAVSNYIAPAAGTYYLQVTGPANVDYCATVVTGGTFDTEPNDSFAAAQPLLAGTAALGAISGSDDWYQVTLNAGDTITLTTTTPGGGPGEFTNTLDPAIDLYDPNTILVGSDDNSAPDGRNAVLTKTALVAGSYRVHVTGAGNSTGEYTLASSVVSAAPPPQVSSIQVNDGSAQRSEVTSLTVTFSGPVTFTGGNANAASAFQLQHWQTNTNIANLQAAVSTNGSGATVVTLTFTTTGNAAADVDPVSASNPQNLSPAPLPSLADGRYQLTVFAANVSGAGGPMAANYVTPDEPSYSPTALHLYRLFGDATGDGVNDLSDLTAFRGTYNAGTGNPSYVSYLDADNSGVVDLTDLTEYRNRYNHSAFV